MKTLSISPALAVNKFIVANAVKEKNNAPANECGSIEKKLVLIAIKLRIFYMACMELKSISRILKTYKTVIKLRRDIWGGELKKLYKIDGKYYFNMYTPGWPSKAYDNIWKSELRRHAPGSLDTEKTFFAFFAITRKCPMRCEHCFEWDNLNQKESFTKEDLLKVIDIYQKLKRENISL